MTRPNDDTQPRSPFREPVPDQATITPQIPPDPDDTGIAGPGCLIWGVVGLVVLGFAVLIVGLSGLAGWTRGEEIAQGNATATQDQRIMAQVQRFPTDIASGNLGLANQRLGFLAALTPGVPGVSDFQQTATAAAARVQATPTPTATTEAPATQAVATTPAPEATADADPGSGPDLAALFAEAQNDIAFGRYAEAIETLDTIMGLDPTYQPQIVRDAMGTALTRHAANLFNDLDSIAEAIYYTNWAESLGVPIGELDYERLVGGYYLDAETSSGLGDYQASINAWQQLLQYQATYKGIDVNRRLFRQYVNWGEAWLIAGQPCQAAVQFINALNLFADATVRSQRDAAQTTCEQQQTATAQPGGDPGAAPGEPTIAPIGVPGS